MKMLSHIPGLKLLFLAFLFTGERTGKATANGADLLIMDNTIYLYRDGNGNKYYFYISPAGNCIMEYDPVTERESSSGEYNGGALFITTITMADYSYLIQLLKVAVSTQSSMEGGLKKGCGAIVVITGEQKIFPLDCGTDTGRTVEGLIAGYKRKYIVTTGKAAPHADTLLVGGKIAEQPYESKKGIVTGVMEYYFIPDEQEITKHKLAKEYYVKLWEGKVLKGELAKYVDKNVLIKVVFKKGLWDATDEQHASRLGDYVAIMAISSK